MVASFEDVTERLKLEARLAAVTSGQLGFLRLIADIAARFVTIEPEAIDDAVVDGLRQIVEMLQLDRAILWQKTADASADASHYWIRHSEPSVPEPLEPTAIPYLASRLEAGEATWFTRIDEIPDPVDRDACLRHGLRSAVVLPVALGGAPEQRGVLAFSSTTTEHQWGPALIAQLRLVSGVFGQALARKASLKAQLRALGELQQLRERMTEEDAQGRPSIGAPPASHLRDRPAENVCLGREVRERFGSGNIIGQSAAIQRVLEQLQQVAATDSTVLLLGETGTGKELLAAHLHELSARRGRLMTRVNCSAIPATLMESELFGREKGAFTGALARQIGRFELADRSTIFLDEIGDLPADVQVKLLRVLEERQIERLGSPKAIHVDVRIIAATHRNLERRIADGTFREDLFYRLNVFPIEVPALRDRTEDIPFLVWHFVDEFSKKLGKRIDAITRDNIAALQRYPWPGNIRELRNIVERAMIVTTSTQLTIALPTPSGPTARHSTRMTDVEREHIRSIVESCGWRIRGSGGAAERLGLRPTTLETRMAKLGVSRPMRL